MNLDTLDRLASTEPEMRYEPEAYKRAVLRMGYEAGVHAERTLAELSDIGQEFEAVVARDAEITRLRGALRGGNATNDNAELMEFAADRLVHVHGEPANIDYVLALRERASMIRAALKEDT